MFCVLPGADCSGSGHTAAGVELCSYLEVGGNSLSVWKLRSRAWAGSGVDSILVVPARKLA